MGHGKWVVAAEGKWDRKCNWGKEGKGKCEGERGK